MSSQKVVTQRRFAAFASKVAAGISGALEETLFGLYVHGSAALDAFNWTESDLDLLVVVRSELPREFKYRLLARILELDAQGPPRGLELSAVAIADCRRVRHPSPYLFHYSRTYREAYRKHPEATLDRLCGVDYDLAAYFEATRRSGVALLGPPATEVFGELPPGALADSFRRNAAEAGTDASGVLNLCRYAAFCATGELLSKPEGGAWGVRQLPEPWRPLIREALAAAAAEHGRTLPEVEAFKRELLHRIDISRSRRYGITVPYGTEPGKWGGKS